MLHFVISASQTTESGHQTASQSSPVSQDSCGVKDLYLSREANVVIPFVDTGVWLSVRTEGAAHSQCLFSHFVSTLHTLHQPDGQSLVRAWKWRALIL